MKSCFIIVALTINLGGLEISSFFFFFFKWPVEPEVALCRTHEWAHSDANKFYIICDGPESIILHNHYQPAFSLPSWLNFLGSYVCCQEENQLTKGSLSHHRGCPGQHAVISEAILLKLNNYFVFQVWTCAQILFQSILFFSIEYVCYTNGH